MSYYEALGETAKAIRDEWAKATKGTRAAHKWAKSFGGKGIMIATVFARQSVCGVIFDNPPDNKLWKKSKHGDYWTPRLSSKDGKILGQQMDSFHLFDGSAVCKAIKMDVFKGCSIRTPGVRVVRNRVFLNLPDGENPVGCTRISDLDYECLTQTRKSRKQAGGEA